MVLAFVLKKIVGRLLFPLSWVTALLLVGTFRKRGRRIILLAGITLLYLFSYGPFSHWILHPLEGRYPVVSAAALQKEVKWVVVLGGGAGGYRSLVPENRLSESSLRRVMEGVRIVRQLPEARLILSEGNYRGGEAGASIMGQVALNQGVPRERIVLESQSWDTEDQARYLRESLGDAPFYLVTSAYHMPRAIKMFERLGARPIAAPTDFRLLWDPFPVFPRAEALANTERAFNEYLGICWAWLRGYI